MAKVCKFCSLENDDKEEFCTKCGAKLPSFRQYEAGLMDEMGPKKTPLIKFAPLKVIKFVIAAVLIITLIYFFKPSQNNEGLPKLSSHRVKFNTFDLFIKNINESASSFDSTINTNQHVLSIFLTSLVNPDAADLKKSNPDILPRYIVKTPADDINKISLVKHSKFYFLPIRMELNFKYNNSKWELENWKFCNLPAMTISKEKIRKNIMQDFKNNEKIKKILSSNISIQRSKLYITVTVKQVTTSEKTVKKANSIISRILQPMQDITQKIEKSTKKQ